MDESFNGLNGTIVRKVRDDEGIAVGRVPGEPYGYKPDLLVTVDFRVERLQRQESYETVTHKRVHGPLDFALTTRVWRPDRRDIVAGGATAQPLYDAVAHGRLEPGWNAGNVTALAMLHDAWHLNSMSAACAHQEVVWEENKYGRREPSLDLTPRCPVTGYRYGSAWLVQPLPEGFLANLDDLVAHVDADRIYVLPGTETRS